MFDYIWHAPVARQNAGQHCRSTWFEKRGIRTLERVAKEGQWTRDDARVLLIAIYKKEKRFPEALALSRELQEKYPRNYLFRLETATLWFRRK